MKIVIGISDAYVSNEPGDLLITHSLGSCIGIGLYDPVAKVGALLHYMLPQGSLDPKKSQTDPFRFGDVAIPKLFELAYKLGATKPNIKVVMAGGANVLKNQNVFNIGHRNITIARKLFWKNRIFVESEEVGGEIPRTLSLDMSSGCFYLQSKGVRFAL